MRYKRLTYFAVACFCRGRKKGNGFLRTVSILEAPDESVYVGRVLVQQRLDADEVVVLDGLG